MQMGPVCLIECFQYTANCRLSELIFFPIECQRIVTVLDWLVKGVVNKKRVMTV